MQRYCTAMSLRDTHVFVERQPRFSRMDWCFSEWIAYDLWASWLALLTYPSALLLGMGGRPQQTLRRCGRHELPAPPELWANTSLFWIHDPVSGVLVQRQEIHRDTRTLGWAQTLEGPVFNFCFWSHQNKVGMSGMAAGVCGLDSLGKYEAVKPWILNRTCFKSPAMPSLLWAHSTPAILTLRCSHSIYYPAFPST